MTVGREHPVDILRETLVSSCKDTKIQHTARFYLAGHAISGWSRNSTKSSLPPGKRLGGGNGSVHCAPARAVCTASCDLHQQRARVQRERGYIITAIGKRSSLRCDGSATAGGCFRVGCHGDTLGPLPRGCSLEYPPSCLFSAIPSSPSFPFSTISSLSLAFFFFSLSLSLFLSLFTFLSPPIVATALTVCVFLPVYIRIHSAVLPAIPNHPPHRPRRPFRPLLFPGWLPFNEGNGGWLWPFFFSLLLQRLIAHRSPCDFISSWRV